jgi:ABC-2 type transport system permease protein
MRILWEQVRGGFLLATSYRLSFALGWISRWSALVWVYFLARLVAPAGSVSSEAGGYLAFALVGMATQQYLHYLLSAFPEHLRESQLAGMVPPLLATPAPPALALFGPVLWGVLERAGTLVLSLLVVAWGFGVPLAWSRWPLAAVCFVLMSLAVGAWGVLSACYTLVFKRGDPVLWLSETLGFVLSGAVIPLHVLPPWMRSVAALYPHAYAIRATRLALLPGSEPVGLPANLLALAGFGLLLVPLAALVLERSIRHVRIRGSAAFY